MENIMQSNATPAADKKQYKLALAGFLLMLLGPLMLLLAGLFTDLLGHMPEILANIVTGIAIVLPGIGAIISIVSLFFWKKTTKWGRALSIVTLFMCNPVFYFFYLLIGTIMSSTLAGLDWM